MSIKSIPDNQGWSAGGYNFYVAEDGSLTKGRPGETPTPIGVPQEIQDFADTFTLPTTDGTAGQALVTNGAGVLDFATVKQGFDFIQSTPTPAATTAGQLWYKPTDGSHPGTTGLWRSTGAYWVSAHTIEASSEFNISVTAYGSRDISINSSLNIFIERFTHDTTTLAVNDGSNHWILYLRNNSVLFLLGRTYQFVCDGTKRTVEVGSVVQTGSDWISENRGGWGIYAAKAGSTSNLFSSIVVTARTVHP